MCTPLHPQNLRNLRRLPKSSQGAWGTFWSSSIIGLLTEKCFIHSCSYLYERILAALYTPLHPSKKWAWRRGWGVNPSRKTPRHAWRDLWTAPYNRVKLRMCCPRPFVSLLAITFILLRCTNVAWKAEPRYVARMGRRASFRRDASRFHEIVPDNIAPKRCTNIEWCVRNCSNIIRSTEWFVLGMKPLNQNNKPNIPHISSFHLFPEEISTHQCDSTVKKFQGLYRYVHRPIALSWCFLKFCVRGSLTATAAIILQQLLLRKVSTSSSFWSRTCLLSTNCLSMISCRCRASTIRTWWMLVHRLEQDAFHAKTSVLGVGFK